MAQPLSDPMFSADSPESSGYVAQGSWREPAGRPDLVDEVADQFERPTAPGSQAFWAAEPDVRWPRASRGWRSRDLLTHRAVERRAG